MRALDQEVVDVVWQAVEPLLPPPAETHPLGCHGPCAGPALLPGILIRLVTGASWVDIEAILDHQVSDTTLRAVGTSGSTPGCSSRSTPKRSGRSTGSSASTWTAWRWTGRCTRPLRRGRHRPQPHRPGQAGLEVVRRRRTPQHPDRLGHRRRQPQRRRPARGHPRCCRPNRPARRDRCPAPRPQLRLRCRAGPAACRRPRPVRDPTPRHQGPGRQRQPLRLGLRWIVEATNTWWSNYGQLRRSTDRRARHRHAALCLATTVLIVGRLIDWRNRWSST
jgi:hypothetical protein